MDSVILTKVGVGVVPFMILDLTVQNLNAAIHDAQHRLAQLISLHTQPPYHWNYNIELKFSYLFILLYNILDFKLCNVRFKIERKKFRIEKYEWRYTVKMVG